MDDSVQMGGLLNANVRVTVAERQSHLEGLVNWLQQVFVGRSSHFSQNTQTFVPHVLREERAPILEDLAEDDAEKPG